MRYGGVLIAMVVSALDLEAQSDSLLTAVLSDPRPVTIEVPKPPIAAIRLASSTGGFVFGILVGGFAGHEMLNRECKTCDKPELDALVIGGAIGGAIGAGLGSAFLDIGSVCTFDKRIMRTMLGSAIGASAAYIASGGLERGGRTIFFVPIGAVGGSLGSLGKCWKSRYSGGATSPRAP